MDEHRDDDNKDILDGNKSGGTPETPVSDDGAGQPQQPGDGKPDKGRDKDKDKDN